MVCHRGDTLRAGHYYAYVTAPDTCKSGKESSDGFVWLRLDDLETPSVSTVISFVILYARMSRGCCACLHVILFSFYVNRPAA